MNKTVTVNISGIIFNIEEAAYDNLRNYLEAIKMYFEGSVGGDEIMADIELRIAELFQERLNPQKQVIVKSDVEEVIKIMGEPEAYADTGDEEDFSTHSYKRAHRRTRNKRVYRDPDNKVLFGVCSGISNYFGWDPLILRVVFLLMFFFYGTGVLLYIILAIIIPIARTTAEKLEMRGDPVTAENIGRKVNESFENVKKNINNFTRTTEGRNRMRSTQKQFGDAMASILDFLVNIIRLLLNFIGKIIGVLLLLTGIILLCGLLAAVFGWDDFLNISSDGAFAGDFRNTWINGVFENNTQKYLILTGTALVTIIPIIGIIIFSLRLLVDFKNTPRGFGLGLISLWIIGFIILTIGGVSLASDFSNEVEYRKNLSLDQPLTDTLYIDIIKDKNVSYSFESGRSFKKGIYYNGLVTFSGFDSTDMVNIENAAFTVEQNNIDSLFILEVELGARGGTQKEAVKRTEEIKYDFRQEGDSLMFSPWFALQEGSKFRDQDVKYILKVPAGKAVHFNYDSREIIHDIPNIQNKWDRDMLNQTWLMTPKGLDCIQCPSLDKNGEDEHSPGQY